jgi:hypothetical protein
MLIPGYKCPQYNKNNNNNKEVKTVEWMEASLGIACLGEKSIWFQNMLSNSCGIAWFLAHSINVKCEQTDKHIGLSGINIYAVLMDQARNRRCRMHLSALNAITKYHRPHGLNKRNYFFTSLEVTGTRSRCHQSWLLVRLFFLAFR